MLRDVYDVAFSHQLLPDAIQIDKVEILKYYVDL